MSALATFMGAFLAVFMVLGAGFTAVMLAVTGNRMFTEFAGTFRAIADTFAVNHGADSSSKVVQRTNAQNKCSGCRSCQSQTPQVANQSDPKLPDQTAQALTGVGQAA